MTDKVAFKDGDKEVVAQRGVKLTNKNSRPAQISRQKAEAREQFERRVLETDEYYNGIINVRVGSSKILKEALEKLGNT